MYNSPPITNIARDALAWSDVKLVPFWPYSFGSDVLSFLAGGLLSVTVIIDSTLMYRQRDQATVPTALPNLLQALSQSGKNIALLIPHKKKSIMY